MEEAESLLKWSIRTLSPETYVGVEASQGIAWVISTLNCWRIWILQQLVREWINRWHPFCRAIRQCVSGCDRQHSYNFQSIIKLANILAGKKQIEAAHHLLDAGFKALQYFKAIWLEEVYKSTYFFDSPANTAKAMMPPTRLNALHCCP